MHVNSLVTVTRSESLVNTYVHRSYVERHYSLYMETSILEPHKSVAVENKANRDAGSLFHLLSRRLHSPRYGGAIWMGQPLSGYLVQLISPPSNWIRINLNSTYIRHLAKHFRAFIIDWIEIQLLTPSHPVACMETQGFHIVGPVTRTYVRLIGPVRRHLKTEEVSSR